MQQQQHPPKNTCMQQQQQQTHSCATTTTTTKILRLGLLLAVAPSSHLSVGTMGIHLGVSLFLDWRTEDSLAQD